MFRVRSKILSVCDLIEDRHDASFHLECGFLKRHKEVCLQGLHFISCQDHTLKFVYVTKWRTKEAPIVLCATPGTEVEG